MEETLIESAMLTTESSSLPSLRRSPAKNPKPNSPEKHDSGISGRKHRCGITDAYLEKLFDEKTTNYWDDAAKLRASGPQARKLRASGPQARPVYGPKLDRPEHLPKGYAWGSYIIGSDKKDLAYRMLCAHCGKDGDHMTDNCLYKDSDEAKEYRKQHEESMKQLAAYLKARRSSDHETKPDNK